MSIIDEKLKFIVQSELSDEYKLLDLYVDYEPNYGMMVGYLVDILSSPVYPDEIYEYLKRFDNTMYKILKRYKFESNGKMVKPSTEINVAGMINKITFEIDEKFEVEGMYNVSW